MIARPTPRRLAVSLLVATAGLGALAPGALAANPPVVTGLASACGPAAGTNEVVIEGTGLSATDTVAFGPNAVAPADITFVPASSTPGAVSRAALTVLAPSGTGTVDVRVTDPVNGTSAVSSATHYTYFSVPPTSFGICSVSTAFTDPVSGAPFTLAGGHPDATISFSFNDAPDATGTDGPVADPKDIDVVLPRGVIGDPSAIPVAQRCTQTQLSNGTCPASSQVGSTTVMTGQGALAPGAAVSLPVFDIVPPPGHPAELAIFPLASLTFNVAVPILISVQKDAGGDYRLVSSIHNLLQTKPVLGLSLTLFATPPGGSAPFTTLAPDCAQTTLTTTVSADSWSAPGTRVVANGSTPGPSAGCATLPFSPSLTVTPTTTQADSAAGYAVTMHLDQTGAGGQEASPLRTVNVTLPAGVGINPALAAGAAVCTPQQFQLNSTAPSSCPQASAVGTVTSTTPLQPGVTLQGGVYLAQDVATPTVAASPFHVYIEAAAPGIDIKLQGTLTPDPTTGQLTTTFDNLPSLPIDTLTLRFAGGAHASLANPLDCGPATTTAVLTPWSSGAAVTRTSTFTVDADGAGGACPATWPTTGDFTAGPTSAVAGGSTGFTFTVKRADRQTALQSIAVTTPPGFTGLLASVQPCSFAAATLSACTAASQIGTLTVGLGAGPDSGPGAGPADPAYLHGTVYLTGPVGGAPYGFAISIPEIVGPFNLESPLGTPGVLPATVNVDPHTAQLTITAPLPVVLNGVPLHVRLVNITIDRPGFGVNPTNCSQLSVNAAINGVAASVPFQVAGCDKLTFAPQASASAPGHTSVAKGAGFDMKLKVPPGSSNLASVSVVLPVELQPRLSPTLSLACDPAPYAADPSSCKSDVGTVFATSPVLPDPLTGHVHLVNVTGAFLPSLQVPLSADGVTIALSGSVNLVHTLTTKFTDLPDVPINNFELNFPEGPASALQTGETNLCAEKLSAHATFIAQDGATSIQTLPVALTGCSKTDTKPKQGLKVLDTTERGKALTLRVRLSGGKGVLHISGADIKSHSESLKAGTHAVKVTLNARGRKDAKRHRQTRITVAFGHVHMVVKFRL
jgi:hypothetical protein